MAEIDEKPIEKICRIFQIRGEYRSCEVLTLGHINTTYKVYFYRDGEIKDYILQRVNTYVFKDPVRVMENITSVTEYVRAKIKRTGISAKGESCITKKPRRGNTIHGKRTEASGAVAGLSTIPRPSF